MNVINLFIVLVTDHFRLSVRSLVRYMILLAERSSHLGLLMFLINNGNFSSLQVILYDSFICICGAYQANQQLSFSVTTSSVCGFRYRHKLLYLILLCIWHYSCKSKEINERDKLMKIKSWWLNIKFCLLNIVFFRRFWNILRTLASLGFPSVSVCVHNGRSNTSTAAELTEFRKITTF